MGVVGFVSTLFYGYKHAQKTGYVETHLDRTLKHLWIVIGISLFAVIWIFMQAYQALLNSVAGTSEIVEKHMGSLDPADHYFMVEFLIWGLEAHKKLNKYRTFEGFQFKDALGSFISGL